MAWTDDERRKESVCPGNGCVRGDIHAAPILFTIKTSTEQILDAQVVFFEEYLSSPLHGDKFNFLSYDNKYHVLSFKGGVFYLDNKEIYPSKERALFAVAYSRLFY